MREPSGWWALPVAVVATAGALTSVLVTATTLPGVPVDELTVLLAVVTYAVVGCVVVRARPGNRVGRLLLLGAASWGAGEGALALGVLGEVYRPGSVPAAALLAVLGIVVRGLAWLVLVLAVPLVFPDGRLPWEGRRLPVVVIGTAIGLFASASLLSPTPLEYRLEHVDSPTGLPDRFRLVTDLAAVSALALSVVALVVAVAGLVHRWRAGDLLRRQQLLWFALAFAAPLCFIPVVATDVAEPWMFAVVTLPVPVGIGFAVLQKRLYDIQLALSRSLTYVALSAVVAGLYALTVGGVGALLRDPGPSWLPWLAAGVVAVCFAPLRNLLQQGVNRLTYGQWSRPAQVLAATGRRLVDAADVPALLHALVVELGEGLGLHDVEIRDTTGRVLAAHGTPGPPAGRDLGRELPLTAYGLPVGSLRWSGRPLRESDRRLLEDLAGQLGGVVHAAALMETVRDAQHRLVVARAEERRRLRRDLHDGLGPSLASLTLRVDTLRNRLAAGTAEPDRELLALRSTIQDTIADVRRIVEGLRPPALDELGLAGAMEQVAAGLRTPSRCVRTDLDALPTLPAAVEVAALRIVSEALANAARHSGADELLLRVRLVGGALVVEVVDRGSGTVSGRPGGVGLASMRERAEEVGGTLTVESRPGVGTTVRFRVPVDGETGVPPRPPAGAEADRTPAVPG